MYGLVRCTFVSNLKLVGVLGEKKLGSRLQLHIIDAWKKIPTNGGKNTPYIRQDIQTPVGSKRSAVFAQIR